MLALLAALLPSQLSAAEGKQAEELGLRVSAPIEIGADGRAEIGEIKGASGPLAEQAKALLAAARYLPARRDGQPVSSRTRVGAMLVLTPVGDEFEVSLRWAEVGPSGVRLSPPNYPTEMARRGRHGIAELRILVGPDGGVLNANTVTATDPAFEQAAIKASRTWKYTPLLIEGQPAVYEVIQPLWFHGMKKQAAQPEFRCPSSDSTPRWEGQGSCMDHIEITYAVTLRRVDI
ncbi:energy transducer TonB [Lysobacter solisilvae (ex Woo and Kim 2020)]|uniref:Energy transducer TonB n=1 Tax=Agrilutibacter terrestris TaxID=2865112 RepID=A0A7H0G0F0_9GAMM|nr:energy transducer TonB [Lysobacter terrestris]QNP41766.1 energy transducer TonB [Lysobacter terrestris]